MIPFEEIEAARKSSTEERAENARKERHNRSTVDPEGLLAYDNKAFLIYVGLMTRVIAGEPVTDKVCPRCQTELIAIERPTVHKADGQKLPATVRVFSPCGCVVLDSYVSALKYEAALSLVRTAFPEYKFQWTDSRGDFSGREFTLDVWGVPVSEHRDFLHRAEALREQLKAALGSRCTFMFRNVPVPDDLK